MIRFAMLLTQTLAISTRACCGAVKEQKHVKPPNVEL